ncbi:cupin domain-containing protein [Aurantimonas sp. MSK8Z-1]|uniref:cupin domain-containing protein n=1 Tax=Mangrovibrevibacter kandeliae TaxID=2968473 RepID=UPI0021174EB9|nr:cupin domain-containing protein [Aurantimonas sp. MSK8Z-1]MCW4115525.1 cupin domain-containing protein [Aurantimonas sp. MSK8Z-1]
MILMERPIATTRKVRWNGTDYTITLPNAETGGAIGMFEARVPSGDGPPVHVHRNEDEVIHVIEGEYEFWLDGQTFEAGAGASVFLPRGVPHSFRVVGREAGRTVTVCTPGGFEGFFLEAGEAGLAIPRDLAQLGAMAARYGVVFTGPAPWGSAAA